MERMVTYVGIYKEVQLKFPSSALKPDRQQHDRRAAYVIAQQYSSSAFASVLSLRQGKIRRNFKKWHYLKFLYLFKNCISQNCVTWSGVIRGISVEKSCLKVLTDKFIAVLMWLLFTKPPYLL